MLNLIPIHDENPTFRTAWVTIALIAINLVVFLVEPVALSISGNPSSAADACRQEAFFRRYAAIPKELTSNRQLPLTITSGQPRVEGNQVACPVGRPTFDKLPALSVLYAMFLHGSWLHILGNMLFLWVFGNNVEDRLGRVRYLFFHVVCGYLATYGFALADPSTTTTLEGASGAIAAGLGAYLVLYPRARVTSLVTFLFFFPARLPAWVVLGSWFVLQYFYASGASVANGAGVAYLAHVVGFIAGIVLIIVLGGLSRRRVRWTCSAIRPGRWPTPTPGRATPTATRPRCPRSTRTARTSSSTTTPSTSSSGCGATVRPAAGAALASPRSGRCWSWARRSTASRRRAAPPATTTRKPKRRSTRRLTARSRSRSPWKRTPRSTPTTCRARATTATSPAPRPGASTRRSSTRSRRRVRARKRPRTSSPRAWAEVAAEALAV